jgi:hypothetical protein
MLPDEARLDKMERRLEALEERFADVLAALANAVGAGLSGSAERNRIASVAQAAVGRRPGADGDGDGDGKPKGDGRR